MRRRMTMAALLVGLLALPTASWGAKLFHSPSDDPNAQSSLPASVTLPGTGAANLNLWLDPEGDTIFSLDLAITSSGSLTVAFSCVADNCIPNPANSTDLTMVVSLVADNINPGWSTPHKIGVFALQAGGAAGDQLTLDSGSVTNSSFVAVFFDPTVLAVVAGCGDGVIQEPEPCDGAAGSCGANETCGPACTCLGPFPKGAQKCINSINKGAAKVAKAQAGDNAACIKNYGKDKIGSAEACITSDPKGKVAKAVSKIATSACTGGAKAYLPLLQTSSSVIGETMKGKDLALIHAIFGPNLDTSIVKATDDKPGAGCQAAIAKAAGKCQDAKLSSFNSCKKDKLKAVPAGAADIESCLGTGTSGIPDGKGKIGKKCGNGLGGTIGKKCGVPNTDALFPPCAGQNLGDCLDQKIECEVCKALNLLNDLSRDCDEFDDGTVNSSCL